MLASVFELIYLYITMSKRDGKPPSLYRMAKETGLTNACLLQRRNLAAELGWIMPPPKKRDRNPDWMVLTATGANRIVEILDRRRKLIWSAQIAISKKRELFPKNLIYTMLPEGKYRKYVQELKAGTELQY